MVATCLDPSILNSPSLDKVMKGSWLAGAGTASAGNDALYAAIVHQYAPKVNPNPNASANDLAGMLPVLSLAAIMKGSAQPVTAAGILKQTEAGHRRRPPDVRDPDLHLQRHRHPVAEVRVLVHGRHRRARQRVRRSATSTLYDPTPLFSG